MNRLEDEAAYFGAVQDGVDSQQELIESLKQQLATFHSAVEHVTEDGCTRRSVVAMPEGWAMVHKDRLNDLELAEEQLSEAQAEVLEQSRIVGMGGERELALRQKLDRVRSCRRGYRSRPRRGGNRRRYSRHEGPGSV